MSFLVQSLDSVKSAITESKNRRTANKTKYDVEVFRRFLEKIGASTDILNIRPQNLDKHLAQTSRSISVRNKKEEE